jgi:hypothetical protein
MPAHPGIVAYEETKLCKMLESESPDEDDEDEDVIPPGPVMDDTPEDPPDAEDKGDARPCSAF